MISGVGASQSQARSQRRSVPFGRDGFGDGVVRERAWCDCFLARTGGSGCSATRKVSTEAWMVIHCQTLKKFPLCCTKIFLFSSGVVFSARAIKDFL